MRVLIIPFHSGAALYSLHSCHLRYSLINNKNSRLRERLLDARSCAESFTSTVPLSPPLQHYPHFTEQEGEAPISALTCLRSLRASVTRGSRHRARGGGARVLPPAPRRAARAERRAGRKAGWGCGAEDGHLKWPLRV